MAFLGLPHCKHQMRGELLKQVGINMDQKYRQYRSKTNRKGYSGCMECARHLEYMVILVILMIFVTTCDFPYDWEDDHPAIPFS